MRSLDLVPISFRSRSASRSDSFFSYIFHAVMNELCTVWFAVVGVRVGMNFSVCSTQCVCMVWLRLGDVSGRCAEWAVHSVICCCWCESWNEFSLCFTQCAHGFVNVSWCEWMCWMSRAQCDLLLVAWESDWVFLCFTQCAHGFVKIWWCQWMCWLSRAHCDLLLVVWDLDWVSFCFTQCGPGFVKIWWCQWMCWMSHAHCDLLLVAWVLAMAWDSVFLRARSNGVSFR